MIRGGETVCFAVEKCGWSVSCLVAGVTVAGASVYIGFCLRLTIYCILPHQHLSFHFILFVSLFSASQMLGIVRRAAFSICSHPSLFDSSQDCNDKITRVYLVLALSFICLLSISSALWYSWLCSLISFLPLLFMSLHIYPSAVRAAAAFVI